MGPQHIDFVLHVLTFALPLVVAMGASMLGSYLLFALPAWIKQRARERALSHEQRLRRALTNARTARARDRDELTRRGPRALDRWLRNFRFRRAQLRRMRRRHRTIATH